MQQLKPRRKEAASGLPASAKISSWLAVPSATHVKSKERWRAVLALPPTVIVRRPGATLVTALLASPPPRTRQYTRMLSPAAPAASGLPSMLEVLRRLSERRSGDGSSDSETKQRRNV